MPLLWADCKFHMMCKKKVSFMPCHGANWLQPRVNEHPHVYSRYYSGTIPTVMPRTIAILAHSATSTDVHVHVRAAMQPAGPGQLS